MRVMGVLIYRFGILACLSSLVSVLCLSGCTSPEVEVIAASRGSSVVSNRKVPGSQQTGIALAPHIINVSAYDPKERQRSGSSYTTNNLSTLRRNGALGLIARCGKGYKLDEGNILDLDCYPAIFVALDYPNRSLAHGISPFH